jgi:large conductance mechanosensitive channel
MSSILQEFKTFAIKGNAIDMAVGIILGASFNKVVNSIVNDLLMPPIGLLIGGVDFNDLQIVLRSAAETGAEAVAIRYGAFVNSLFEFVIVAFSAFVVVKIMNRLIAERDTKPEGS